MSTQRIRTATSADASAIKRLAETSGVDPAAFELPLLGRRYVIVLESDPGELVAAAAVQLAEPRAHLVALAIAPGQGGEEVESRIFAVADALARAFGCDGFDVPRPRAA